MNELTAILTAWSGDPERALALATLVKASGSTYRRPGARMLVFRSGDRLGAVSAGCLERDILDKAAEVAREGRSILLTYDTSADGDIVFGSGLGCKGSVHILLEPLRWDLPGDEFLRFLSEVFARGESAAVATVFRSDCNPAVRIGSRLMLDTQGKIVNVSVDPGLDVVLKAAATEALAANRQRILEFMLPGGRGEALVEVLQAPVPLVIVGAGYDAVPLCRMAKLSGFHVTVADPRPGRAAPERFPEADAVCAVSPGEIGRLNLTPRTAVIVMSHNYLTDCAFFKTLLPLNLRYLGLMGPRMRARQMLEELRKEGLEVREEWLRRVYNPIGLDIGAENPEQIALAIVAEIQSVVAGRSGGSLREKKGPIHEPGS